MIVLYRYPYYTVVRYLVQRPGDAASHSHSRAPGAHVLHRLSRHEAERLIPPHLWRATQRSAPPAEGVDLSLRYKTDKGMPQLFCEDLPLAYQM